jgi:hypothetical protein
MHELSRLGGAVLNAKECTITLLSGSEVANFALQPGTGFGEIPKRLHNGHQARKAESGEECTLPQAGNELLQAFVEIDANVHDTMFSTIVMQDKVIGVIQACQPQQRPSFNKEDLRLFGIFAHVVSKSIQIIQLQAILKSRFAQIALTRSGDKAISEMVSGPIYNSDHIARVLAKSFYKEMTRAGFNCNQIISAASEVISELSSSLRKHKRVVKGKTDETGRLWPCG